MPNVINVETLDDERGTLSLTLKNVRLDEVRELVSFLETSIARSYLDIEVRGRFTRKSVTILRSERIDY